MTYPYVITRVRQLQGVNLASTTRWVSIWALDSPRIGMAVMVWSLSTSFMGSLYGGSFGLTGLSIALPESRERLQHGPGDRYERRRSHRTQREYWNDQRPLLLGFRIVRPCDLRWRYGQDHRQDALAGEILGVGLWQRVEHCGTGITRSFGEIALGKAKVWGRRRPVFTAPDLMGAVIV